MSPQKLVWSAYIIYLSQTSMDYGTYQKRVAMNNTEKQEKTINSYLISIEKLNSLSLSLSLSLFPLSFTLSLSLSLSLPFSLTLLHNNLTLSNLCDAFSGSGFESWAVPGFRILRQETCSEHSKFKCSATLRPVPKLSRYGKCNFPMTPIVRLLVGRSVIIY